MHCHFVFLPLIKGCTRLFVIWLYCTSSLVVGQKLHSKVYGIEDGLPEVELTGAFKMDGIIYAASRNFMSHKVGKRWKHISSDSTGHNLATRSAHFLGDGKYFLNRGSEGGLIYSDNKWIKTPPLANCESRLFITQEGIMYNCPNGERYKLNINNLSFDRLEDLDHVVIDSLNVESWISNIDQSYNFFRIKSTDGDDYNLYHHVATNQLYNSNEYYIPHNVTSPPIINHSSRKVYVNSGDETTVHNLEGSKTKLKDSFFGQLRQYVDSEFLLYERVNGEWQIREISHEGVNYLGSISETISFLNFFYDTLSQSSIFSSHVGLVRVDHNRLWFESDNIELVDAIHFISEDNESNIWFGGYGSGLSVYDGAEMKKDEGHPELLRFLPGAHRYSRDDNIYSFMEKPIQFSVYKNGKWERYRLIENGSLQSKSCGYIIRELRDSTMILGLQGNGLGIVDSIGDYSIHYRTVDTSKGMSIPNVLGVSEDKIGRIWIAGRGMALYERGLDTAYSYPRHESDPRSFSAMSLTCDSHDRLWIGTHLGLYVLPDVSKFDPTNQDFYDEVQKVPLPNGENTWFTSVMNYNDNLIIAGGVESVNLIPLDQYNSTDPNPFIYQLYYGDDISGSGTEQNCIMEDSDGHVWIGTQTGAMRIDPRTEIWDTLPNQIEILSQVTGKGIVEIKDDIITLPSDSRNLVLEYGPDKDAFLRQSTFYDRYLINTSGDTLQSLRYDLEGRLELNYLQPGDYTLVIIAKKHNQVIDTRRIEITVPMTLSENPLFWGGLGVGVASLLGVFFFIRSQQKRELLQKNLQLAKLENEKDKQQIQAIISSFNPHFINNSLHWAQSRYNRDEPFVRVIGRLSANIRHLFAKTTDGKPYHTIHEELDIVKNYLAIQEERFKDEGYEYRLPTPDQLQEVGQERIFLMQLQILVENAIEHGIRHLEAGGYVEVQLEDRDDDIIFTVTDNGIGRTNAAAIGSTGTQQGLKMLRTLHELYNQKNNLAITMSYEDSPTLENGERRGTKVTVILPKQYNYEF